jgi:hypothetical protein
MIYGFKNRKSFFEFKLFILTYTFVEIRHRWALEFVGIPNLLPKVPRFWDSVTRICSNMPESDHCRRIPTTQVPTYWSKCVIFNRIPITGQNPASCLPNSGKTSQKSAGRRRNPHIIKHLTHTYSLIMFFKINI